MNVHISLPSKSQANLKGDLTKLTDCFIFPAELWTVIYRWHFNIHQCLVHFLDARSLFLSLYHFQATKQI